jgi:hypothetical protein
MASDIRVMENRLKTNSGGQWIGNLRAENGDDFLEAGTHDGQWYAFQVWEDAVITTIERPKTINGAYMNGKTITAGKIVYGKFTQIVIATGVVQAFTF